MRITALFPARRTGALMRMTKWIGHQKNFSSSSDSSTAVSTADVITDLSGLEFKVGKIMSVESHPETSGLYVEQIDVGDKSGPRTIVSGLQQFVSAEQLLHRSVVVLCNLKPRKFKSITSDGMIMCVSNETHTKVDPITPPSNACIGELITFPGHKAAPVDAGNKATKLYTKVADFLHVDETGIAMFKTVPFTTTAGPVTGSFKGKIS